MTSPGRVLAAVGGPDRDDPATQVVTRVLGARLVLQAATDLVVGRRIRGVEVAVDLTHAASMLPVAAHWPSHRRTATVSAVVAGGIAALDLVPPLTRR
jgi:hypothetical protein